MRRIGGFAVLVLALMLAPTSDASTQRKATCAPRRSHILKADALAAVYTIREGRLERFNGKQEVEPIVATRGCDVATKRSYRLHWEYAEARGAEYGSPIPANLTLAGAIVAYEESFTEGNRVNEFNGEEYVEEWHVIVRDLRTGRVLHRVPTGTKLAAHPKFVGRGETEAIVVKSDGAVAWIAYDEQNYELHALDKAGERILAVGSNIAPHSLSLVGSTLRWRQGGEPESASLN